ncbi:MAG: hypothetical protein LIP23_03635, partial [Planctomycetes bacterium]|nr:hypothetical protein [Planctomycetota bacterium]
QYQDGFVQPQFDAPVAWSCSPLRISIRQAVEGGFEATLHIDDTVHQVFLPMPPVQPSQADTPAGADGNEAEQSVPPQPGQPARSQRIGEEMLAVEVEESDDAGGRYVRYLNPELPFGLARFASPDVEVILVGAGSPPEPDFPLRPFPIEPPAGSLMQQGRAR